MWVRGVCQPLSYAGERCVLVQANINYVDEMCVQAKYEFMGDRCKLRIIYVGVRCLQAKYKSCG